MATEIVSNGDFKVKVNEAENSPYFEFNGAGDVVIGNPDRNSEGRALVPFENNELVINFGDDFAGVTINNLLSLKGIPEAPSGMNLYDIAIDNNGIVYKKD